MDSNTDASSNFSLPSFIARKRIRPIAICLFRHGGKVLVNRDSDSAKGDHYWRPLGGGIEFQERSKDAIVREISEEIGLPIKNVELLSIIESLFTLEGHPGHDIVFVYDAEFCDPSVYESSILHCHEHANAIDFTAQWMSPQEIRELGDRLVPDGIEELIGS